MLEIMDEIPSGVNLYHRFIMKRGLSVKKPPETL